MTPEELMRISIEKTREGIAAGQTPFGCAILLGDKVVANSHNVVWRTTDITAHAEITALREACKNTAEVLLEGSIAVATCEPCPMCMSALHWARVKTVYYGATIEDAATAGFNELSLSAADVLRKGGSTVELIPGLLREECADLFREWHEASGKSY